MNTVGDFLLFADLVSQQLSPIPLPIGFEVTVKVPVKVSIELCSFLKSRNPGFPYDVLYSIVMYDIRFRFRFEDQV